MGNNRLGFVSNFLFDNHIIYPSQMLNVQLNHQQVYLTKAFFSREEPFSMEKMKLNHRPFSTERSIVQALYASLLLPLESYQGDKGVRDCMSEGCV